MFKITLYLPCHYKNEKIRKQKGFENIERNPSLTLKLVISSEREIHSGKYLAQALFSVDKNFFPLGSISKSEEEKHSC